MDSPIRQFSRRAEDDDFFLASAIRTYARSEGMDEAGLAEALGCAPSDLDALRLCRRPRPEPPQFEADVVRISSFTGVKPDVLAQVVRRADILMAFRQVDDASSGMMMAARDRSGSAGEAEDASDDPD